MHYLISLGSHAWSRLLEIAKTPLAWISGLGLFVADSLAGGKPVLYIVILAVAIDLICGIAVAIKQKKFAKSELMKQTVEKLVVYGAAMLVFLGIDHVIEQKTDFAIDITSSVVGTLIVLTETWSFLALLLILFPDNPFLRMFQKKLTGELARKLDCDEKEVAKILKNSRKVKAQPRSKNGRFVKSHKKANTKTLKQCGPLLEETHIEDKQDE